MDPDLRDAVMLAYWEPQTKSTKSNSPMRTASDDLWREALISQVSLAPFVTAVPLPLVPLMHECLATHV